MGGTRVKIQLWRENEASGTGRLVGAAGVLAVARYGGVRQKCCGKPADRLLRLLVGPGLNTRCAIGQMAHQAFSSVSLAELRDLGDAYFIPCGLFVYNPKI